MTHQPLYKRSVWLGGIICSLASFFYIYDYFIQVAPSVITQELMRAFSINAVELGVLGSCFFVTYTLFQVPAGILLDRFGARRVSTLAVLVCALGVTLFSVATSLLEASVARALVGAGSAFSFLGSLFLISRWFEHRHFALLAGFVQFASAIGSIFGQGPFALFVNSYGWRNAIWMIGMASFILVILFWTIIRDGQSKNKEETAQAPLSSVFKHSQLWWVSFCAYIAWAPASALGALWGVPYLMQVYHINNYEGGQLFTGFWLVIGIGGPIIGWFSDKIKRRKLPFILCFSLGLLSSLALLAAPYYSVHVAEVVLCCLGFAVAVQSLSYGLVKDMVPANHFGASSGIANMVTVLSGATLQPLIGALLQLNWTGQYSDGTPVYSTTAYQIGLSVVPVVMAIGLIIMCFFVKETYCQPLEK